MADPTALFALSASGLAALGLATAAALRGWSGWIELRRLQVSGGEPAPGLRAEIARLRERVKRLEAIASGGEG